jgi:hypothetical protein
VRRAEGEGGGIRVPRTPRVDCFVLVKISLPALFRLGSPFAQEPSPSSSYNPIMSLLSTLDDDALVPIFGTQGARDGNAPKSHIGKGAIRPLLSRSS